jgi:hypothetical protein
MIPVVPALRLCHTVPMPSRASKTGERRDFMQIAKGVFDAAMGEAPKPLPPKRGPATLRVTPGMQAGLSDHAWEIEELVALLD